MQRWSQSGVRTEKIIVEGRVFDAPLVVTHSGEILPLVVRFPGASPAGNSAVPELQRRQNAAEALLSTMHLILAVPGACKRIRMEKAADEIVKPSLQLTSDAIRLYRASESEEDVQRLCVLIARQVRMGLVALRVRGAVFRGLKTNNPNILYRRFTRFPKTDDKGNRLKDSYGRTQIVIEVTKDCKRGKSVRPPRGHTYEIIQAAATVGMPSLQADEELGQPTQGEQTSDIEFHPIEESPDAFEDLCRGYPPEADLDCDPADSGLGLCYGDEPHLCCALPSVTRPSACCETELHNLILTRWEPWGTEETSALVACAILLEDGALLCERMLCHGLNRRMYGEMRGRALDEGQKPTGG